MIDEVEVVRAENEPLDDIEAMLEGRIFHVTKREHWLAIKQCGVIRPNQDGSLPTTFGFSTNSHFRKRGCVSLFDWRDATKEVRSFRYHCWPLTHAVPGGNGIAILFLKPGIVGRLITWEKWKQEAPWLKEMVVPHVEAGHEGRIPIEDIERVLLLRRTVNEAWRAEESQRLESLIAETIAKHARADEAKSGPPGAQG